MDYMEIVIGWHLTAPIKLGSQIMSIKFMDEIRRRAFSPDFSFDRRHAPSSLESHQCELPLGLPPSSFSLVLPDLELGLSRLDSVHVRLV